VGALAGSNSCEPFQRGLEPTIFLADKEGLETLIGANLSILSCLMGSGFGTEHSVTKMVCVHFHSAF
jgi:hypothetical protein